MNEIAECRQLPFFFQATKKKGTVPIAVLSNFERQMPQYTFDFESTILLNIFEKTV